MTQDNLQVQTEQPNLEELALDYKTKTLAVSIAEADLQKQNELRQPFEKALSLAKEGQAVARSALLTAAINLPSA